MLVFGGYLDLGRRSNDLYKFYFNENRWEKIEYCSEEVPEPRSGHSCTLYQDKLVIFGGKDSSAKKLNDIWMFHLDSAKWEQLQNRDPPKPRSGHSATLYKDKLVVFGGIFEITQELNDMHIYDLVMCRWVTFFEELASPSKRKKANTSFFNEANGNSSKNAYSKIDKGISSTKVSRNSIRKIDTSPNSLHKPN